MLIAQISDPHIGFVSDDPDELNTRRLAAVLARIAALEEQPKLLIASGDLAERGDEPSYRRLRDMLSACPFPVHYALGNHDDRAAFATVFPEATMTEGFLQYAIEQDGLRILVLDTLDPGKHGGAFCSTRARWLTERLDEAPEQPTILVLHHPPIATGIDWLTTDPRDPWVQQLAATIRGRANILALLCGHIHRAIVGRFEGIPVIVSPSIAPAAALALAPIDPAHPDDRPLIVDVPPGYTLHRWADGQFVSHFDRAEPERAIVRYDETMRAMMQRVVRTPPAG